jgi:hypothetical protein
MKEELKIMGSYALAVFGEWWFIAVEGLLVTAGAFCPC